MFPSRLGGALASLSLAVTLSLPMPASAQNGAYARLPAEVLDVRAPTERVVGRPGEMRFGDRSCRSEPVANLRTRIVDTAVQEWAYFGFSKLDYTTEEEVNRQSNISRSRWSLLEGAQAIRLADSIAGYWAAAPDSAWILQRQNERWKTLGLDTRWRDAWSAAFISWVMCENGLGDEARFARAVAHHTYIDQAIRARDGQLQGTAYVAFDTGEQPVQPGDLLCRGSRPAYRSLDERRRHLGVGARTHCDIVVKVDEDNAVFSVIGGNVRGTVGMKLLPATRTAAGNLAPAPYGERQLFAHLKLNADAAPLNALDLSPTMQAAGCVRPSAPTQLASLTLAPPTTRATC